MIRTDDILNDLPKGKKILALSGPKGSGKDTAAARLLTRNQIEGRAYFKKIAFAGPIKKSCQIMFGLTEAECEDGALKDKVLDRWPYVAPRRILMDEANHLRERWDPEIHVRAWLRHVAECENECIVVTDLRFPDELERIRQMGGRIVYIERQWAEDRLAREWEEGGLGNNPSESHYSMIRANADVVIPNNSDYGAFFDAIRQMVISFWGPWQMWEDIPLYRNS